MVHDGFSGDHLNDGVYHFRVEFVYPGFDAGVQVPQDSCEGFQVWLIVGDVVD